MARRNLSVSHIGAGAKGEAAAPRLDGSSVDLMSKLRRIVEQNADPGEFKTEFSQGSSLKGASKSIWQAAGSQPEPDLSAWADGLKQQQQPSLASCQDGKREERRQMLTRGTGPFATWFRTVFEMEETLVALTDHIEQFCTIEDYSVEELVQIFIDLIGCRHAARQVLVTFADRMPETPKKLHLLMWCFSDASNTHSP